MILSESTCIHVNAKHTLHWDICITSFMKLGVRMVLFQYVCNCRSIIWSLWQWSHHRITCLIKTIWIVSTELDFLQENRVCHSFLTSGWVHHASSSTKCEVLLFSIGQGTSNWNIRPFLQKGLKIMLGA